MSLNELAARQEITGQEIQRAAVNYKKDSAARKTEQYLAARLKTLDQLWEDFEATDSKIRISHGQQLDHDYFTKGYYEGIRVGYHEVREDILDRMKTVSSTPSNQPNHRQPQRDQIQESRSSGINDASGNALTDSTTAVPRGAEHQQGGNIRHKAYLMQGLRRLLSKPSLSTTLQSVNSYELMIKTISAQWEQIQDLHKKLVVTAGEAYLLEHMEDYLQLEEQMQDKLLQLHEGLSQCQRQSPITAVSTATEGVRSAIKLPKIELPKFDGDYLKWRQFSDLYTELVHNQTISAGQKLWYLKGSLSGEAEKLIRHLTVSDANYATAWKLICDRYENKRLLVTALLNKLLAQPAVTTESAAAIKMLHDTTQECLLALSNLGIDITNWDPIILHILIRKLDRATHTLWEQSLSQPRSLQSLNECLEFLENRFQSLEALGNKVDNKRLPTQRALASTVNSGCPSCKGNHPLFACKKLLQLSPAKRVSLVKNTNACFNCLKMGHNLNNCTSRGCSKCGKRHNTLLHIETTPRSQVQPPEPKSTQSQGPEASTDRKKDQAISLTTKASATRNYVLLSTACVRVINNHGTSIECRAILDCGSQLNFISERLVKKLGLTGTPEILNIEGIGSGKHRAQKRVNILLESRINGFSTRLEAHVLPRIISPQPSQAIDISTWQLPANIQLADPRFNQPDNIDLLIGAGLYYSTLSVGQIKLGDSLPVLQNTVFGWTAAGTVHQAQKLQASCGICSEDEDFRLQIEKFWALDDAEAPSRAFTTAERRCEEHFVQTTRRTDTGRFVVRLPFKDDPNKLGESKKIAYQRLMAIERKLSTREDLRNQYISFMEEYIRLGHMREINFNEVQAPYSFLPHHCVSKPESTTTKLRVVFDASAKTSSNISLNDLLATGPTIQDDVFSILLRFRLPRFVFTADIEKMYRQIEIHQDDRKYQLIWWRNNPSDRLRCYELGTVTYGTTSAPYLATRCLKMLAETQADQYPLGTEVLNKDFYVDDVLTGADNLSVAIEKQSQLQSLLQSAGLKLRKWCANHHSLLKNIPREDQELQVDFCSKSEEHIKTMGLIWRPKSDDLCIRAAGNFSHRVTKRTAYSEIAQLFDPLGIIGPVVVTAKIFLQKLWMLKCDWDAALPQELHSFWLNFREGLRALNDVKIPRHVLAHKIPKLIQIHVFADASEKAYGAAAYVRSIDRNNMIAVRLLCAKSRVAPIKQTTLPRLELCAAKLAAELAHRLKKDLDIKNSPIFLWTDSEIVLAWINAPSSSYQTFVANRISSIQQLSIPEQWRHVRSKENPADVLSRGIMPEKLGTCNLWLYGPTFLHGSEDLWPPAYTRKNIENDLERRQKPVTVASIAAAGKTLLEGIDHRNSFRKMQRIIAYALRFIKGSRKQSQRVPDTLVVNVYELSEAQVIIIRLMQQEEFRDDLTQLQRNGEVSKDSKLSSLAPFIDSDKVIRVGGRLEASKLPHEAKHPALLPCSHPLTKCLLSDLHKENKHVGPQTLLAIARQTVWPIKGKTLARSVVQHCIQCTRARPKLLTQMMGNLPADRVQPARPFVNAGVDFCGPIWTHFKIRGKKPQKSYIAVFCCFPTKATHLEVVSDLSTQGFLGALRRFTARRGHCKTIYCDNATNFVGAKNILNEVREMLASEESQYKIKETCSARGIDFRFIPPRAPHFGGLWEAAVKAAKHLLQRTLGSASLTYEELETAVVEIEAILNSRPITPMSSDPNDLTALTPGHFLIGEPLTSTVDPNAEPARGSLITRWRLVSHIKNEFWKRWSTDYLNQLQHRYKWKQRQENVIPGTMVLIKEDNVPPLKWLLGRIINVIKGEDDLVRVVDVRTANGVSRRPIHKLAPLPVVPEPSDNESSERVDSTTNTDQHASSSYEHSPRKRPRLSLGSAIVSLLLACLVLPVAKASAIEITPFSHQPGIYFENLGAANIISNEWDLVVYYDLAPYWKEYECLQNYTMALRTLCKKIDDNQACRGIVSHLEHLLSELTTNNMLLSSSTNNQRRRKRGAFNFIGNVANALFGVLDSEYAEKMTQTIANIKGNEDYTLELMKNQTSVLDATLNIMKREEEAISHQFHSLQINIEQVTRQINGIMVELYQEKLAQTFVTATLSVILTATNFLRIQNSILDVIADIQHGRISPLLVAPQQLKEELIKIKTHLPSSLQLPLQRDEPIKYYSLIRVQGRITTRYAIFKLVIPLLSSEEFELFKVTPVPVRVNNSFMAIKPSSPFLIINLHRDQYYPMTEQELQACIIIEEGKHLCNQNHPVYRRGSSVSECEVSYMNHAPPSPTCQIIRVEDGPHWIQLYTSNEWIYVLTNETTINVVCGDKITQHVIQGTGILKIRDRCLIRQPLVTIQGHNSYPSVMRTSYIPLSNLTDMNIANRSEFAPNHTAQYQSYAAEIDIIKQEVQQLKMHTSTPVKLPAHDIHQFSIGYVSLVLIAVIGAALLWKHQTTICPVRRVWKPAPAPRQQHNPAQSAFNIQFDA